MSDQPKADGRCPLGHGSGQDTAGDTAAATTKCPWHRVRDAVAGLWRPKSKRTGMRPGKYVYWNAFYFLLQAANRALSFNKNHKISWDKWPKQIGVFYALAKMRFLRSNALTDPYDYASTDTATKPQPADAETKIYPDGSWVADDVNGQMGAAGTRFGSNRPPEKVRPDVEEMEPSAREAGKLRWRKIVNGKEVTVNAMILNDLAGWWIQFQFHGFGGNTKRDPVGVCPHMMKRTPEDNWPEPHATIDRTSRDTTRVTDNGRPTVLNERPHAWIQAQVYGGSDAELNALRSFEGGKLRLDEHGMLPEDLNKKGVDLTGFSNNYSPGLSFLHWLFVQEHNAIADYYASFHPDWDDEQLFNAARRVNAAQIARIHTIEWTEDLLQHPTLQLGMHADWYGFLGQKTKMWLMRLCHRYRWARILTWPLRQSDVLWGAPGSPWEHYDGPFQVPKHFRLVYRLHEMVLSEHDIHEPETDKRLDRIDLINFVHENTRPIVERFGYETLAWSFVRKSCGHLVLHNVPRAMTQFKNMQDGTLTDICERDIFRERTDGTGTYNEFRASVGEPPVTSFMELTGGDAELAKEIEMCYGGDINAVDAGIGILAQPKPAGFALGYDQFYQFVLNAPRRVKSNRHLTELFTYASYGVGMNWVEHGGGMLGAMGRHLPKLRPLMEGVTRGFAPWPKTETFPDRVLNKCHEATATVFRTDVLTLVLGIITALFAVAGGLVTAGFALKLLACVTLIPAALTFKRMFAMRFLQQCWKRCYTDKRQFMFGTLERAEQSLDTAGHFGALHALLVSGISLFLAWTFFSASPIVGCLLILIALNGLRTRSWSKSFVEDARIVKIAVRNRMREGLPVANAADLPGDTDIERRYWFLRGDNKLPIATFKSCYHGLINTGLPPWKAFFSTLMSIASFGPKSRRGMTAEERRTIPWFSIYLPNLIRAKGRSSTRIFAAEGNRRSLRAGNIDMVEFDLMFRRYAPGRDYLTAYDFSRMAEGNAWRDADEGLGNWLSRTAGRMAAKRRSDQLLMLFADRVVEEDKKLVPAISREMMLRFYNGAAQADLYREHNEGDRDPSPVLF